jgi:NADPH-dependent curcumin reductase CurA
MSSTKARQIVLAARPQGKPRLTDFRLEETQTPTPGAGQVLLQVQYLSLDPYMRGRMDDRKSYATPTSLGAVMPGESVAKVVATRKGTSCWRRPVGARTHYRTAPTCVSSTLASRR